jgi:hypothetical protein
MLAIGMIICQDKVAGDLFNLRGLASVRSEQMDSSTFDIVSAGDQLSFKMSKQIAP